MLLSSKRGRRFFPPPSYLNTFSGHLWWQDLLMRTTVRVSIQYLHFRRGDFSGPWFIYRGFIIKQPSTTNQGKGRWHFFKKGDCFSARFPIELHAIDLERQGISQNWGGPKWKKKKNLLLTSIYQNKNRISLSFPYKQKGLSVIILVVTIIKKKTEISKTDKNEG